MCSSDPLEPAVNRIPDRGTWASRPAQHEAVGVVSNNSTDTVTASGGLYTPRHNLPKYYQTHRFPFRDPGSPLPRMIVTEIQTASC